MKNKAFERTALLLGDDGLDKLLSAKVAVVGLGGVGGYVAEALIRSGIGKIILVDYDFVDETNINRQLIATLDNIGKKKVFCWERRANSIREDIEIRAYDEKFSSDNHCFIWKENPDFIADAIDDVRAKIFLVAEAHRRKIEIISAMGCGNKLDPTGFRVADIYETSYDPLSRVMRKKLRGLGISKHKVVYSEEKNDFSFANPTGSTAFCPSVAGLIMAAEIVKSLCERR